MQSFNMSPIFFFFAEMYIAYDMYLESVLPESKLHKQLYVTHRRELSYALGQHSSRERSELRALLFFPEAISLSALNNA